MKQEIIDFINKYENLIDDNRWEEVYTFAQKELFMTDEGQFTSYLLSADIHPENYFRELPGYFLYKSDMKEFIIPDNITSIGYSAFGGCENLTSITIPNSVTIIGTSAFEGCTSLATVNYSGTQAQWSAITKGIFWSYNTGAYTIIYNYGGPTDPSQHMDGIIKKSR
jgi:hypothetical protein